MTIEARDVVEERVVVPPREGRSLRVDRGRRFRVVDLEGHQCGDLFAFVAGDVREYASAEHTRVHVDRLFPRPGEEFVTNRRRPILHFEADDSPGVHDMLIAACDPARFAGLGVEGWHASCQENLQRAMAGLGHADVEIPQPINLFTDIGLGPHRELLWRPAPTRAGDSVTMRAELDSVVVLSACPQDIVNINECQPGPLAIELLA
jgi:uncharacterized protein YcgI (DUF1989 family)